MDPAVTSNGGSCCSESGHFTRHGQVREANVETIWYNVCQRLKPNTAERNSECRGLPVVEVHGWRKGVVRVHD